jgi:DNA-binding transcriptional MerR regulator
MSHFPENEESSKRYHSISEVAEMLGVSASLIRFWEGEFEVLKPHKNSKGERRFTAETIEQLEIIYQLVKIRGFTLHGAKQELKIERDRLKEKQKMIEKLREMRKGLEALKKHFQAVI